MNTAIRPEDMERYLREMRAFAKRAGYTISPPSPPAPPAVEEPPAPPATEEEPAQEPANPEGMSANEVVDSLVNDLKEQERVMDESGGEEPAAPEEEETPCVPCEAAAEDDGL